MTTKQGDTIYVTMGSDDDIDQRPDESWEDYKARMRKKIDERRKTMTPEEVMQVEDTLKRVGLQS